MGPELVLLSGAWCRGRALTRPRMRNLLALLADDPRAGCGTARLVDGLWPEGRPANPPKALQVLVSHTRALLGQDVIVSTPVGYRLGLREDDVDAAVVLRHAAASAIQARAGDHTAALDHAEAGLALWDGPPDVTGEAGDPMLALRAARAVTHGALTRERALALSRLARHAEALPVLTALAGDRDEAVMAELLRSEAVGEIACHLVDRFALLRGGPRDAPARHRTLHAVVDWSWHLLGERARAAMRALLVFPGGFTTEAARHLLGGDVLPVLEQLTEQSLLTVSDTAAGARFRMLETVREFSGDHRRRAGESADVTRRFLAWARDFGIAHRDSVFGDDPVAVVAGIRAEQDNLVQALRHAVEDGDGPGTAGLAAFTTVSAKFTAVHDIGDVVKDAFRALNDMKASFRTCRMP